MSPRMVLAAAALAGALGSGAGTVSAQSKGESWEYAMTVNMDGMKMPMPPSTVCVRPEDGHTPPVEKHCTLKDRKVSGATTTFHIVCGPPEPGEMKGQFTRKGDRVEGRYTMKSADGEMAVTSDGRKTGACDPSRPMLPGSKS